MTRLMNAPPTLFTNLRTSFLQIPAPISMLIWVIGLWLWGTLVSILPNALGLVVLIVTMIPSSLLFWKYPEYGVVALVFFTSGFLVNNFVEFGGLEIRDFILFLMFGITLLQQLIRKHLVISWWPVGGVFLVFIAIVVFSLIYALFEGVPTNWALGEARILFLYLLFFIVAWGIDTKMKLYRLILGGMVITSFLSIIGIIQQFLGPDNLLLSGMYGTNWLIDADGASTRVVSPGIGYQYFMMLICIGLMVENRNNRHRLIAWFLTWFLLVIGLIFTFTRSSWAASGISIILSTVILFPIYKPHFFRILTLLAATAMFLIGFFGLVSAPLQLEDNPIYSRFTSIFSEETSETNSLQWRVFEQQQIALALQEHPITGVGLGNSYRNITTYQGEARGLWVQGDLSYIRYDRFTRYAHSSYSALSVKLGIPGIAVFLGFCILAMLKGLRLYFQLPDSFAKYIPLMISTGILGLLQWAFYHAVLMLAAVTCVIAIVIGMLACIDNIYINNPNQST